MLLCYFPKSFNFFVYSSVTKPLSYQRQLTCSCAWVNTHPWTWWQSLHFYTIPYHHLYMYTSTDLVVILIELISSLSDPHPSWWLGWSLERISLNVLPCSYALNNGFCLILPHICIAGMLSFIVTVFVHCPFSKQWATVNSAQRFTLHQLLWLPSLTSWCTLLLYLRLITFSVQIWP